MAAKFDPYHTWLAIPPEEQPPHHYRLLALKPLEANLDVIENAADQRMKHLRDYQSGKHGELSQKLLNEVAAARVTLLDPEKKKAYDAELRTKLNAAKQAELKKAREERPLAMAKPLPTATPLAAKPAKATPAVQVAEPQSIVKPRASNNMVPLIVLGVVALLLLGVGGVAAMIFLGKEEPTVAVNTNPDGAPPITTSETEDPATDTPARPVVPPVIPPAGTNDKPSGETPATSEEPPAIDEPDSPPTTTAPAPPIDEEPINEEESLAVAEEEPAEEGPKKLPVPEKAEREAKRKDILAIFPLAQAKTFEQKGELAAQLIRTAGDTVDDPAAVFAMLNLAREQAAEAGHIKLAFEATDMLGETFEFDTAAVRIASLQQASRAQLPPAAKRDIVIAGMDVIDELSAADKFEEADALSDRMLAVARPLRDAELIKQLAEQKRAVDDIAASYKKAHSAFETLKTSPDDAEANLAAGKYLTFMKQDWDAGLAHLAKGSDAPLAAAAKGELAAPESPAEQEKLADAWWAAAEAQKDAGIKDQCRAQAITWYQEIVNELSGLAKIKIEKRIAEAGEIATTSRKPRGAAGRRELEVVFLDDIAEAEFYSGHGQLGKHGNSHQGNRGTNFLGQVPEHTLSMSGTTDGVSFVSYDLDGSYDSLVGVAGLWSWNDGKYGKADTPLTFRVLGDGKVLWQSGVIQKHSSGQEFGVKIRNVRKLRLELHCPGSNFQAMGVWINPRISRMKPATAIASTDPELGALTRDPIDTPAGAPLAPAVDDLWDVAAGTTILAHSDLHESKNLPRDVRTLFGVRSEQQHVSSWERESVIFKDVSEGGAAAVEWQTKRPVTVRRLCIFAAAEGGDGKGRRFSRVIIMAWNARRKSYEAIFDFLPGMPYGESVAPKGVRIETNDEKTELRLEAVIRPVTAQRFRAQFIQGSGGALRVTELDAFATLAGDADNVRPDLEVALPDSAKP